MAIKLVFEDNKNTPSSLLLKSAYYGKNIYFSTSGSSQVLNTALHIKSADDMVYIFYDVVPDNGKTIKGYYDLIKKIREEKYQNVNVVPIICIEYHICKMFNQYGYFCVRGNREKELIDKLVKTFDWEGISVKPDMTLEKVYKNIINLQHLKCLRNNFEYCDETKEKRKWNSLYGIFYEKECVCDSVYCDINCKDSLGIKAERLYTSLPFFVIDGDGHKQLLEKYEICISKASNGDIQKSIQDFYDIVGKSMGLEKRVKVYKF